MLSKYGQFSRQFKTRGALKIVLRRGRNGARIKSFYSLNHEMEILSQDPKETRNTLHLNGIYISVKHDINIIVPCHRALRKGFISLCAQIKLGTIQVENRVPAKKNNTVQRPNFWLPWEKEGHNREVQSLAGLLNFACSVIHPGGAFLRTHIDLTIDRHPITVTLYSPKKRWRLIWEFGMIFSMKIMTNPFSLMIFGILLSPCIFTLGFGALF